MIFYSTLRLKLHALLSGRDPRDFQIFSLTLLLSLGLTLFQWDLSGAQILVTVFSCLATQLAFIVLLHPREHWMHQIASLKSALISSLSLCLLLRSDSLWYIALAGVIAVSSKFILRTQHKHLFNPTNLAILVCLRLVGHSWISPAQWGTELTVLFIVAAAGSLVLSRADRLDVSVVFLLSSFLFDCVWNCAYLGWPLDFVTHKFSIGSLYLFAFFMITDPRTIPDRRSARTVWTISVALVSSVLSNIYFMNSSPLYALVFMTPLTPLIDKFFPADRFQWKQPSGFHVAFWKKSIAAACILILLAGDQSTTLQAFCGFYAARADVKLLNKSSQVILARNGSKTTVTMESDFEGDVSDFAMIIPVPEILKKTDVRVINDNIFKTLDQYSTPRLSEYFDVGPCPQTDLEASPLMPSSVGSGRIMMNRSANESVVKQLVRVEAQYTVGEYDIVILSAEQSEALVTWLHDNGYKIPRGAEDVIEPYIKSHLNFFVAKVNLGEHKASGAQSLRPIQISYNSSRYMLPIRLGMANANQAQDLTIYAFSSKGRVECANYRTVQMPTGKVLPEFVKHEFASFYKRCFDVELEKRHRSCVFTEYVWDLSPRNYSHCDPCTGAVPDMGVMREAGVDWINNGGRVTLTRLHLRYDRSSFPQDLTLIETFNTNNYQVLYTVHHVATDLSCGDVDSYLDEVLTRREEEVDNYIDLAGYRTSSSDYDSYINALEQYRDKQ